MVLAFGTAESQFTWEEYNKIEFIYIT